MPYSQERAYTMRVALACEWSQQAMFTGVSGLTVYFTPPQWSSGLKDVAHMTLLAYISLLASENCTIHLNRTVLQQHRATRARKETCLQFIAL